MTANGRSGTKNRLDLSGGFLIKETDMKPILFALALIPVSAQALTGADLERLCSGTEYEQGFCQGYVNAYLEAHYLFDVKNVFCPKGGVSTTDVPRFFTKWAKANPDRLGEPAFTSLDNSLAARWPCADAEAP